MKAKSSIMEPGKSLRINDSRYDFVNFSLDLKRVIHAGGKAIRLQIVSCFTGLIPSWESSVPV
jgi:hypothetical protein